MLNIFDSAKRLLTRSKIKYIYIRKRCECVCARERGRKREAKYGLANKLRAAEATRLIL